jgi:DNA-binding transcriptional MocR family regulator
MNGPRLSIIPAGAVFDQRLEGRDLQVLGLLGCYTDKLGWCRRSQVKMAQQINCGRSSVQRSLDRLVDAGWVEKKRRDAAGKVDETSQPSASYAYRVVLDRDDFAFENATRDREEDGDDSHAENASEQGECPPVGTPISTEGAQPEGHPGAQPERAPGAQPYVGTKNDPLERPLLNVREMRARGIARQGSSQLSSSDGPQLPPTIASEPAMPPKR